LLGGFEEFEELGEGVQGSLLPNSSLTEIALNYKLKPINIERNCWT
jgi:hypothetical protein